MKDIIKWVSCLDVGLVITKGVFLLNKDKSRCINLVLEIPLATYVFIAIVVLVYVLTSKS
jgi:hypothetical protein